MPSRPIAVFGATGAQGGPVVNALLDRGCSVRAIAKTPERLVALQNRGVGIGAADLDDPVALREALDGVGAAFIHLPFIPVPALIERYAANLARALEEASVPLTVYSLSGPVPSGETGVASMDARIIADDILGNADVAMIRFEPMGYLGNLVAPFTAPSVVDHGELRYPLSAEHRQAWISVEDQADLAVAALDRPDLAGNSYRIGQIYTGEQLATGIGEGLEREIRYVPISPRQFGLELVAPFMGTEIGRALEHDYSIIGERPPEMRLDADTSTAHSELRVPMTALAEWAQGQNWTAAAEAGRHS